MTSAVRPSLSGFVLGAEPHHFPFAGCSQAVTVDAGNRVPDEPSAGTRKRYPNAAGLGHRLINLTTRWREGAGWLWPLAKPVMLRRGKYPAHGALYGSEGLGRSDQTGGLP
jgi:hypothetical protein